MSSSAMERASELAAGLAAELGVASAHEYSDAFMRACTATWDAASSWVYLAWLVVLPASRAVRGVTTSVWPHVREGVRLCWATFVAQGRTAIAAELSAVVLVILAILLKRHIARQKYVPRARAAYSRLAARVDARYTRFLDGLRKQSQTLAALFPHVAYAALVGIALRFLPSLAHSAAELTWALRVGLPLLASTHALANANRKAEVHWLQYWVVFASATLARALARAIPGGASLLALVPHGAELELAGYGWLHLPGTRSVEIAYGQLRPLYGATAPLRDRAATGWAPIGRTLAFATELLPARARTLSRAAADSGVLALALLFLPMPARLTHGGCLLFGLGYPAYASAAALWELEAQAERARERARRPVATPPPASGVGAVASALLRSADKLRRRTTGGTAGTDPSAGGAAPSGSADSDNASAAIAARTALSARLQYWTVRVALASALSPLAPVLAWVPLVTHAELLGLVWLQMPYFGGAARAHLIIARLLSALVDSGQSSMSAVARTPPVRRPGAGDDSAGAALRTPTERRALTSGDDTPVHAPSSAIAHANTTPGGLNVATAGVDHARQARGSSEHPVATPREDEVGDAAGILDSSTSSWRRGEVHEHAE